MKSNKKKPGKKPVKIKKTLPVKKVEQPTLPLMPPEVKPPIIAETPQPPRGMRDILPADEQYWDFIFQKGADIARSFGYGRIETPILEYKSLFSRGVGQGTDIVQKEMYTFADQGGEELCLRPENTAAIARAYVNHGMVNLPQPVKLWYHGPFFRRERPQAGRFRQFHQWGVEALGDAHPVLDAEIISITERFFHELGLKVTVQINSIGCETCRGAFKNELINFYRGRRELLCETCKDRLGRNPLRLLDCKESQCELLKEGAPQITDALDDACRDHFMKVLEYLDETGVAYVLNPYLVRGLDYYNRTVFEIISAQEKPETAVTEQEAGVVAGDGGAGEIEKPAGEKISSEKHAPIALGGGGRYDGLVEQLGGRPTPACGVSLGVERIITLLKEMQVLIPPLFTPKVFIAQLGESARRKALTLWHTLRRDVPVSVSLTKDGLKPQLEAANRLGVRFAIIIGQKEVIDGTAIVRDMEAGIQEVVDYSKVEADIKKKLG